MIACVRSYKPINTSPKGQYGYKQINKFEKDQDDEMNK